MKTTAEQRAQLRSCFIRGYAFDIACTAVLDDLDEALIDLTALQRVSDEDLYLRRSHDTTDPTTIALRWCVVGPLSEGKRQGFGPTLSAALADYDAKKEQR